MNQNAVVLEISSDEEEDNNRKDNGNDNGDDLNWLTEVLEEVNKENYSGEDKGVAVNKSEKSGKKLKIKLKNHVVVMDNDNNNNNNNNNNENDDDDDECVVLENDPNEAVNVSNDNRSNEVGEDDDNDEIVVVSEKGKVACRDYPHSRHLCIKFPFSTTPNQSHCEQCYCYVCDSLAPCIYWGNGSTTTDHCHATDKDELWRHKRKTAKNCTKPVQPVHKVADSLHLNQLHPVHSHRQASAPEPAMVQPPPNHTSANFRTRNIIKKNRNPLFASRYKYHPDLVSHYRKTNVARTDTDYDLRTQIQRPVLKNAARLARCRTSFGNPSRQQNSDLNGMLSDLGGMLTRGINTNNHLRPTIPPIATNASSNLNLNRKSRVNSNPVYQQPYLVPPLPPRSQVASSQSSYTVPAKQSYPVSSLHRSLPVPTFSNRTQSESPVTIPGFKEKRLHSATENISVTNEATKTLISATAQGSVTNESSLLEVVPDELTNYDWIFDSQPAEQGFTSDIHGVYGLNDFSSDSSFVDGGPIFDF